MNDVKKNYIYNVIYQLLVIVFPLITMPYVSRIIGPSGVGVYSYTHSIVYYFVIISMLGINNYGNRCIAKNRDDLKKTTNLFVSIYLIQFVMTLLATIVYSIFIIFSSKYKVIFIIQMIYLLSCFFDINWFYFGIEKFKFTTTINIIMKILVILFLFIFVKNDGDVWKYTFIMTFSILISQVILWIPLKKYIDRNLLDKQKIIGAAKRHIVPCLKLFIPVIAVSLYKYMDKIMLGSLTNITNVALYENAEKVVTIPICLITALGTVMLPKMAHIADKKDKEYLNNIIIRSMEFAMFLAFPITMGLIAIGVDFAPLFFGNDFAFSGYIIQYLSITNIFISWASVIRTQYLIPKEKDNIYIISVIVGAITNFLLNIILIRSLGIIGIVIGTIIAEFVVMVIQTWMIRMELDILKCIKTTLKFFITSMIMFFVIEILGYYLNTKGISSVIVILAKILIGIFVYCIGNFRYIMMNIKSLFRGKA